MEQTSSNKQIRIAIADDHKMVRDMIVANINSIKGCIVVFAAADGQELLNWLEKCKELPDMCLLDINMPELNGYDTQIAIRKRWPEMKTLAMSIYDDEDCIVQMLKYGANGFISKNWGIERMEEGILSVYKYGAYPENESSEHKLNTSKGLPALTEREKEYLTLTCAEFNMDEIAEKMGISKRSVELHRDNVYRKTKVNNKADLIFM